MWRNLSQHAHVALIIGVTLGVLVFSYVLAEMAFTWFGTPCQCMSSEVLGNPCFTTCISIGGITLTEGPTKVILGVVLPMAGAAIAEAVLRAGAKRYEV